jgi:flagellar biosynthesis/type III secretory pathway chaperone
MNDSLRLLIDALRDELQHYGGLLALLDQQQELVVARAADDILDSVAAINLESSSIQVARQHREVCQRRLARELGLPEDALFSELTGGVPPDYRPLLTALAEENNSLLIRAQQRARQNHLLLTRSMELMQRLISTLLPVDRSTMYGERGALFAPALPARPLYEAVG